MSTTYTMHIYFEVYICYGKTCYQTPKAIIIPTQIYFIYNIIANGRCGNCHNLIIQENGNRKQVLFTFYPSQNIYARIHCLLWNKLSKRCNKACLMAKYQIIRLNLFLREMILILSAFINSSFKRQNISKYIKILGGNIVFVLQVRSLM